MPVSVRAPDEHRAVTNRLSAVLANLPVGEPDPLRRLALIREQMDALKRTSQATGAEILTGMAGLAAPMWLALGLRTAFRLRQPLVQGVTTDVPGLPLPRYVLGPRMTAVHPYIPIASSLRISVAIFSYLDTASFGITADLRAVPDLGILTDGIARRLAELGCPAAHPVPPANAPRPRKKSASKKRR